jgi:polygalacturonase
MERRSFLKAAAQTMLAAPAAASLGRLAEAQQGTPAKPAQPAARAARPAAVILNVRDLGATGDGKTKDTLAIQQTIDRCAVFGGGEVVVPAGDYLTGALVLRSGVTLRVEEGATINGSQDMSDYPLTQVRWEGHWIKGYNGFISAMDAESIGIVGTGKIIGNPALRGRVERGTNLRYPALIEFNNCKKVRVEDVYTQQFGMWSTHPVYCEDVTFKKVTFKSGADGIDVDSCRHVVIDGCTFETEDDCISLKSGRGAEGNTIGRVCEDVVITNCTMSDANFACIGIGSETSAGVRDVRIEHCKMIHAKSHAIYIKSRVGRGAFVENVSVTDLDVSDVGQGFLRINSEGSGKSDGDASVPGEIGIPVFRNFRFSNVRVNDVPDLVAATETDPRKPIDGFVLENVTGTCRKGIALANMTHVRLKGIKVMGFDGPLLSTVNVSGDGLEGATPIEAAKPGDLMPAPATPFVLK